MKLDLYKKAERDQFYRKIVDMIESGGMKPIPEHVQKYILSLEMKAPVQIMQGQQWVNELLRISKIFVDAEKTGITGTNSDLSCFWIKLHGTLDDFYQHYKKQQDAVYEQLKMKFHINYTSDIVNQIEKILPLFNDDEMDLLEYERHCQAHPFQDSYHLKIKKNDDGSFKLKDKRKGKNIKELEAKFKAYILKYNVNEYQIAVAFAKRIYKELEKLVIIVNSERVL